MDAEKHRDSAGLGPAMVLSYLRKQTDGMTISQLVNASPLSEAEVREYLKVLQSELLVESVPGEIFLLTDLAQQLRSAS